MLEAEITEDELVAMLDPQLRPGAIGMREGMTRFTPMTMQKLAERRAWIESMRREPYASPVVESDVVAMDDGSQVTVYIVNPRATENGPGILHLHGGGFTASTARGSLCNVQELAEALGCTIVTVDYTLAPEATYAESCEQDYAALVWMHEHAAALGVDPQRIAVLGESAGGGHAALLAINARDRGEVPVLFQALIYPMLDDRTGSTRPVPAHIGAFGWNSEANAFGWQCFLGQPAGLPDVPKRSVPARVEDLSGLPPTFIGVGALDLFVDESIEFARRLVAAAVPTELIVAPAAFHGFDMIAPEADISRQFTATKIAALRRAFASRGDAS